MNIRTGTPLLIVAAGLALAGAAARAGDDGSKGRAADARQAARPAAARHHQAVHAASSSTRCSRSSRQRTSKKSKWKARACRRRPFTPRGLAGDRRAVLGAAASDAGLAHLRADAARPGARDRQPAARHRAVTSSPPAYRPASVRALTVRRVPPMCENASPSTATTPYR